MHAPANPTLAWKPIALPAEHGGWGFLAEPVVLGLAIAPSFAGFCLGLATVAAFLARHPLRLWLTDRRKGVSYPRTAVSFRFFAGYAVLALAFLAAAFAKGGARFWPVLAAALPVGLIALRADAAGRSREAAPEAAGAAALGASASAIALAGGAPSPLAWGAWALLAARAVTSVLYVRSRIRLDRGLPAGPGTAIAAHALALAAAVALTAVAAGPRLAVIAFLVLLARAAWGLSTFRRPVRPQSLGYQELGFGLLTLALLAIGYRIGA
jgi:hypothetical protein